MTDYKDTLNLPKTPFPMRANLTKKEPEILKKWHDFDIYKKIRQNLKTHEKFILHDGPPYANGEVHAGHALNRVLKDMIIKSKTLSGFNAPFIPGWDCHGLPIETKVEKKLGKSAKKFEAKLFREKCKEYALSQVEVQRSEMIKLGVFADWKNAYLTLKYTYEADVMRALAQIIDNGYLEKGFKPVHWCIDCQSALAEAEVEYGIKKSEAIYIRFPVVSKEKLASLFNVDKESKFSIAVWTTTAWTLPANQAVAFHPDIEYSLLELNMGLGMEYILVAKLLIEEIVTKWNVDNYKIIGSVLGKNLEHLVLQHPFESREVPCILGKHVTVDTGTGAVHTAPGHGVEDFEVAEEYNLPVVNPVGANGCFLENVEFFAKQHVFKVTENIINLLKEKQVLIFQETIEHSYPHCWRHKSPVIYRTTSQWFISVNKNNLRAKALQLVNDTKWIPAHGKDRIHSMIADRPHWCISRQNRAWGIPMGIFIHKKTGELHPNSSQILNQVADLVSKEGIEAWYALDAKDILKDDVNNYEKSMDTLDVWFDSGASHFCVLKKEKDLQFPADLYLEGSDQYRGWYQSSLLTSIAMGNEDQAPYKGVLTHGYTLDGENKKMSKAIGNVINIEQVRKTLGSDILRLWAASVDYQYDTNISDEILKRSSDAYRRIRNTIRFFLANLIDFEPRKHMVDFEELLELDLWAIHKTHKLQNGIIDLYNKYSFHHIFQKIHNFCSLDMGSFYLDIIKDRQYTCKTDSLARRSCQTAIYHILQSLLHWLAPILSFTVEEAWQYLPGEKEESIFLTQWYQGLKNISEGTLSKDEWDVIIKIRDEVNKSLEKARNQNIIGSALDADVILYCNAKMQKLLEKAQEELKFIFITSSAIVKTEEEKSSDTIDSDIEGLAISVEVSSYDKCVRCWHRNDSVGKDRDHPELCLRCVTNVSGDGEIRKIA